MDITILLYLQQFREATLGVFDSLFLHITTFGEDMLLFLGSAGIYWCVNKRVGFLMCFHYHLANYLNQFIKLTACVNRPWIRNSRIHPVEGAMSGATGYSFPSGHTAKATAVWGSLGMGAKKRSRSIACFFLILVILVGVSRNYLGVHTPQDVLISLGIGAILLWVVDKTEQWVREQKKRAYWLCAAGILLSGALIGYATIKTYSLEYINGELIVDPKAMILGAYKGAGGVMGLCLGWLLETKIVKFKIEDYSKTEKIIRFLYGTAGLVFILKVCPGLWNLWIGGLGASVLNGFFPAFYLVGGFPLAAHLIANKRVQR